eukprot:Hpha_TRINITY_DN11401_c0_g1::TRINITY_DN11401_c0_g1_i2::g.137601::m.137601
MVFGSPGLVPSVSPARGKPTSPSSTQPYGFFYVGAAEQVVLGGARFSAACRVMEAELLAARKKLPTDVGMLADHIWATRAHLSNQLGVLAELAAELGTEPKGRSRFGEGLAEVVVNGGRTEFFAGASCAKEMQEMLRDAMGPHCDKYVCCETCLTSFTKGHQPHSCGEEAGLQALTPGWVVEWAADSPEPLVRAHTL